MTFINSVVEKTGILCIHFCIQHTVYTLLVCYSKHMGSSLASLQTASNILPFENSHPHKSEQQHCAQLFWACLSIQGHWWSNWTNISDTITGEVCVYDVCGCFTSLCFIVEALWNQPWLPLSHHRCFDILPKKSLIFLWEMFNGTGPACCSFTFNQCRNKHLGSWGRIVWRE